MITFLVQYLVAAYSAICWTLFYFDLRIRKEGYDLELAAKPQPVTAPAKEWGADIQE